MSGELMDFMGGLEEIGMKYLNEPVEHNAVVKPSHYVGTNGLEVKQVLEEFVKDKAGMVAHRWCSAVEYLLRAYEKNGKEVEFDECEVE